MSIFICCALFSIFLIAFIARNISGCICGLFAERFLFDCRSICQCNGKSLGIPTDHHSRFDCCIGCVCCLFTGDRPAIPVRYIWINWWHRIQHDLHSRLVYIIPSSAFVPLPDFELKENRSLKLQPSLSLGTILSVGVPWLPVLRCADQVLVHF